MTNAANTLVLMAGGDVGPVKQPVDRLAELVLPTLRQADFRLVQCERIYSKMHGVEQQWTAQSGNAALLKGTNAKNTAASGTTSAQASHGTRLDPELASIYTKSLTDVICLASNHTSDWGPDPLLDTVQLF